MNGKLSGRVWEDLAVRLDFTLDLVDELMRRLQQVYTPGELEAAGVLERYSRLGALRYWRKKWLGECNRPVEIHEDWAATFLPEPGRAYERRNRDAQRIPRDEGGVHGGRHE